LDTASVLVADSDATFSAAVGALVLRAGFAPMAAGTGDEALRLARAHKPTVVLLDVGLRDPGGFETCRELRELFGESLPILLVSAERTEASDRVAGLMLGADDYLVKPVDPDELLARIRRAALRALAQERDAGNGSDAVEQDMELEAGLTPRELEVLRLISRGRTPKEISEQLVVSPKTVSSHLQRILAKLGVHSRLQAVARAYELGIVAADSEPGSSTAVQRGARTSSASPVSGGRR